MSEKEFEPKIVAFCCHYCAFAAADLAGVMRLQYPTTIRIVRIPCTGKLDIIHLMRAFEHGADGVMVAGCLEGQCHFIKGNFVARKRVEYAKELLEEIGMDPNRLEMYNLSSSQGPRFAEITKDMDARIRELGPSPLRPEGSSKDQPQTSKVGAV